MKTTGLADLAIHLPTYQWTARAIDLLRKMLKLNLRLHCQDGAIEAGEIFVFNHFARFETFIPQYLIYKETKALCRSVAAKEFFVNGSPLGSYLVKLGAVPNTSAGLFSFLAKEILHGRKIIMFPEGGMVKDRRVIDRRGRFAVYSRMAGAVRRPHTGAAVLALLVDIFKTRILEADAAGKRTQVDTWAFTLGFDNVQALLSAAKRPTLVVPANITFYPLRVNENLLYKTAELFNRGLSRRLAEELLVEGNILLKKTDMDVRLGKPVSPSWGWWQRPAIAFLARRMTSLDNFPGLFPAARKLNPVRFGLYQKAVRLRDEYMGRIYRNVTINMSHLASDIILTLARQGRTEIDPFSFRRLIYTALKNVQKEQSIHVHPSLSDPEIYEGILDGGCVGLEQFLQSAVTMGLIEHSENRYRFLPKLLQDYAIDEVRLENLVRVYSNEVAPIPEVARAVKEALDEEAAADGLAAALARRRFDDELLAYARDKERFRRPPYDELSREEKATESGESFLLLPQNPKKLGVLLVHGFLASPAEMRPFAEKLKDLGYPALGIRLKGHGTSPWDLAERHWADWLKSLRRGYEILSAFAPRLCLLGFSAGGVLSLILASKRPENLAGTITICAPVKLRNRGATFAPFAFGAGQLVRWIPPLKNAIDFYDYHPENPHINYRKIPARGVVELRRMIEEMEKRLPEVKSPVYVVQASEDPAVDPGSGKLIYERLGSSDKKVVMVTSDRHGILYRDAGNTHDLLISVLENWTTTDH